MSSPRAKKEKFEVYGFSIKLSPHVTPNLSVITACSAPQNVFCKGNLTVPSFEKLL